MKTKPKTEEVIVHPNQTEVREAPSKFIVREVVGRAEPVEEKKVLATAYSLYKHGQLQPIWAVKDGENYDPIFGFTRIAASQKLRDGFLHDGIQIKDPDFVLWSVVVEGLTEQDRFLKALAENNDRNTTTDWDDAVNQQRLRGTFKFNETEIAKVYGYDNVNRVSQLRNAYDKLTPDVWKKVHTGRLSLSAATKLYTKLGDDVGLWDEALRFSNEKPEDPSSRFDGGKIDEFIRSKGPAEVTETITAAPEPKKPKGKKGKKDKNAAPPRKVSDVRKWLQGIVDSAAIEPAEFSDTQIVFAKVFLKFLDGANISDRVLYNRFNEVHPQK